MEAMMKHRTIQLFVLGCCAGGLLVGCTKREETTKQASTENTHVATSTPDSMPASGSFNGSDTLWNDGKPLGQPVASFGSDTPTWTSTTVAAANRGTTGKPATVVGEVVDVSCYMQLGKRGEKHIPCGTDCVKNGAPIGVVDAKNELYIVMAEEHDPRRYGNIALKEAMLPFMAKTVQVTGMLNDRDGVKTLYVQGYTVDPNQPSSK
jgi:hypothetical protein